MHIKLKFRKPGFRWLVAVFLLVAFTNSCAGPKYWKSKTGQVLDEETKEPVSGVHVIALWSGDIPVFPAEFIMSCYFADSTMTNEQGEYEIASHIDGLDMKMDKRVRVMFYKPGYRYSELNYGTDYFEEGHYFLTKDSSSGEERLAYLKKIVRSSGCDAAGRSQRKLFPYLESIYYEAKEHSVSPSGYKSIEWFRDIAASAAIASDNENDMSGSEYRALIEEYLKDHLR